MYRYMLRFGFLLEKYAPLKHFIWSFINSTASWKQTANVTFVIRCLIMVQEKYVISSSQMSSLGSFSEVAIWSNFFGLKSSSLEQQA